MSFLLFAIPCVLLGAVILCLYARRNGVFWVQSPSRLTLLDYSDAVPSGREMGWHLAALPFGAALVAASQTNTAGWAWLEFCHLGVGALAVMVFLHPLFMAFTREEWTLRETLICACLGAPFVFFISLVATSGLIGGLLLVLPGDEVQVQVKLVSAMHEFGPQMSCSNEVTYTFVDPVTRQTVRMCSESVPGVHMDGMLELNEKVTWLGTRQISLRAIPP